MKSLVRRQVKRGFGRHVASADRRGAQLCTFRKPHRVFHLKVGEICPDNVATSQVEAPIPGSGAMPNITNVMKEKIYGVQRL